MTLDAPALGGTVRTPRLKLTVDGQIIPNPLQAVVVHTNEWTSAQWSAQVALEDANTLNAAWWAAQANVKIGIEISTDGLNFTELLVGVVDEMEIEPETNLLTLTGRDLTALLIDIKTANTYQNQTASEIATILANQVGLTPVVTATKTPVGQFYAMDHVKVTSGDLSSSITAWDLLVWLAQQSGFDVFVEGESLYFQPAADETAPTFAINTSRVGGMAVSDVMGLTMKRSFTLAKDIQVTVKSWHSGRKSATTATVYSKPANTPKGGMGPIQHYVFYKPNLSPEAAAAYANQKMAEITRHERVITFEMPGELNLSPRSVISLTGTGTAFDQNYYPDMIHRSISFRGGYVCHVTARNHSPVEEQALPGTGAAVAGNSSLGL